jgi:transcriptional regulator with XRE-family HTH domain
MKNKNSIKELLGMKQEEMAMLLQTNRSQWSMYLSGKRNLPVEVKLKLASMLEFLNQKEQKNVENLEFETKQNLEIQKYIASQHLLNAKLQIIMNRKLALISKKYNAAVNAVNFINFLEEKTKKPSNEFKLLLSSIKQNNETQMQKNSLLEQTKLQIKIESIQQEGKILKKRI